MANKFIYADYVNSYKFAIPDGIDIDEVHWDIKYNVLYIQKDSEDEWIEIEGDKEYEHDMKFPWKAITSNNEHDPYYYYDRHDDLRLCFYVPDEEFDKAKKAFGHLLSNWWNEERNNVREFETYREQNHVFWHLRNVKHYFEENLIPNTKVHRHQYIPHVIRKPWSMLVEEYEKWSEVNDKEFNEHRVGFKKERLSFDSDQMVAKLLPKRLMEAKQAFDMVLMVYLEDERRHLIDDSMRRVYTDASDEYKNFMRKAEIELEFTPTDELKECNYKHLRIVKDFFAKFEKDFLYSAKKDYFNNMKNRFQELAKIRHDEWVKEREEKLVEAAKAFEARLDAARDVMLNKPLMLPHEIEQIEAKIAEIDRQALEEKE